MQRQAASKTAVDCIKFHKCGIKSSCYCLQDNNIIPRETRTTKLVCLVLDDSKFHATKQTLPKQTKTYYCIYVRKTRRTCSKRSKHGEESKSYSTDTTLILIYIFNDYFD